MFGGTVFDTHSARTLQILVLGPGFSRWPWRLEFHCLHNLGALTSPPDRPLFRWVGAFERVLNVWPLPRPELALVAGGVRHAVLGRFCETRLNTDFPSIAPRSSAQGFSFLATFCILGEMWFLFKEYRDAEATTNTTVVTTEESVERGGVVTTTTTTETHTTVVSSE